MTWKKPWEYPVPDSTMPGVEEADFMLAYGIRSILMNAGLNFLAKNPDPNFADPQSFLESIITYAVSLTQNNFTRKYASPNWNPVNAGFKAAYSCMNFMKQLPVNAGDEHSVSIYDAWVAGTGQLYGGHPPIVTPVSTADTGPNAAPAGTIFN